MAQWSVVAVLGFGALAGMGCAARTQNTEVAWVESCEHGAWASRQVCSGFSARSWADRGQTSVSVGTESGSAYAIPGPAGAAPSCPDAESSLPSRASCGGYAALPLADR
jgi:hypothetical protein